MIMKKLIILPFVLMCVSTGCLRHQHETTVLLDNFVKPTDMRPEWNKLFTDNYAITPLETNSDCLVGQIDKIKKWKSHYYILSSNGQTILHFDDKGKYVSSLNKTGQGPEEYHRIEDFDVCEIDGQTEVWVSDNKNLKIYDATDFSFKYKIPYSFIIYKFRRLENSHILLLTGQNDKILTLTDQQGNIISEYQEKEIPFVMFRPVQFVTHGTEYFYQLGVANAYISFDSKNETFRRGRFVEDASYLTEISLLELFNNRGTDFILEANKGSYINNIVFFKNIAWLQTVSEGKNYLTKIQSGQIVSAEFLYGTVLSTITVGDSDDSALLYITPEQLLEYKKDLFDKFGNEIKCEMEDNPYILEFL